MTRPQLRAGYSDWVELAPEVLLLFPSFEFALATRRELLNGGRYAGVDKAFVSF